MSFTEVLPILDVLDNLWEWDDEGRIQYPSSRDVAAAILRAAADILAEDQGDSYPPDVLRDLADQL